MMNTLDNTNHSFQYTARLGAFFVLIFKNFFLSILTLGIYIPWAIVDIRKFSMEHIEIFEEKFSYTGKAKDIVKGFLITVLFLIVWSLLLGIALKHFGMTMNENGKPQISPTYPFVVIPFYIVLIFYFIIAIFFGLEYDAKHTHYRDNTFSFLFNKGAVILKIVSGIILTVITFGIYSPWFAVSLRKYVFGNLSYGENITFGYVGKGLSLFFIHLTSTLFTILTFGIYAYRYQANLINFHNKNLRLYKDGEEVPFSSNIKGIDVFAMQFVNSLILIFTLGLGFPIIIYRNQKFLINSLNIHSDSSILD